MTFYYGKKRKKDVFILDGVKKVSARDKILRENHFQPPYAT